MASIIEVHDYINDCEDIDALLSIKRRADFRVRAIELSKEEEKQALIDAGYIVDMINEE